MFITAHRKQRQHGPGEIADIGADLIAILKPFSPLLVPPAAELYRARWHAACGVAIAQSAVVPVSIPLQRRKQRVCQSARLLWMAASDQRNRCDGLIVEEAGLVQRAFRNSR